MKPMDLMAVSKLEAANRQLATAIRMFLNDADAIAVHTLACASREIYEKHLAKQGRGRFFDKLRSGPVLEDHTDKELWDVFNLARNFFKHLGKSLDETIEFSDEMNDFTLMMASDDCAKINGKTTDEVYAFMLWIEATHESFGPNAGPSLIPGQDEHYASLDAKYPGLRDADRAEKKRFGRALFSDGCQIR